LLVVEGFSALLRDLPQAIALFIVYSLDLVIFFIYNLSLNMDKIALDWNLPTFATVGLCRQEEK
jgi:hypothetical protein